MSETIEVGKICVYIGPGDGRMLKHRVIAASREEVITWSQFPAGEIANNGYSWLGDRKTFCQQFRPCLPSEL